MVEIFEDRMEQQPAKRSYHNLMTAEQVKRGEYYAQEYYLRDGEMAIYMTEWQALAKLNQCDREKDPQDTKAPCNFVPILTPAIEGQTASMIEADIEFNYVSSNPGHSEYAKKLNAPSKYNRRESQFMFHMKDFVRSYLLYGNAWLTVSWEKSFDAGPGVPIGYARFSTPSLVNVFVDGRIKDYKDLQYAEYIIERKGFQNLEYARKRYGDDYANALAMGSYEYEGDDSEQSYDDTKGWTLLHVWTRNNDYGNVQLIEMDTNGLILKESDPINEYYPGTNNRYPFFFCRGIPKAGCFYGFGDGKILQRFQETLNCLFDEMEYAARYSSQGKIIVDPAAEMDDGQLNSNPGKAVIAKNPNQNIMQLRGAGLDQTVYNMANMLFEEAQKAIRFSEIMTGVMPSSSATATQINGQLMQGAVGIRDKKSDIAQIMAAADKFALKLCIANWDKPFWVSDDDGQVFFDSEDYKHIPATIGRTQESAKRIMDEKIALGEQILPEEIPMYETVQDDDGNPVYTSLMFDVDVVFANAVPRGKNDMFYILLSLMQLQVIDDVTGQPTNFLKTYRARKLVQDCLGIKIVEDGEQETMSKIPSLADKLKELQLNPPTAPAGTTDPNAVAPMQQQQAVQPQGSVAPGTAGVDLGGMMQG